MEITNFLTLPDQRQLAYAEYGDPLAIQLLL